MTRSAPACNDSPLPIGKGQAISQPYIVAVMTEILQPSKGDRVLEIETGSGYAAAILSRIVYTVYIVERYQDLAASAQERFRALHYDNIQVLCGMAPSAGPSMHPKRVSW
jgi:protein-L-isoaspartate(D-aspartate) O-methyltransferase